MQAAEERFRAFAGKEDVDEETLAAFYGNAEEHKSFSERRGQRISLMVRMRLLLSRIYRAQGLYLRSFFVTRQALVNFRDYCFGRRRVEKGEDDRGSFSLPEMYGGSAAPPAAGKDAGKKAAPPDPKKAAGKGPAAAPAEEESPEEAEAKRREAAEEEKRERDRIDQ